ncbi:hypothetical protein AHGSH82_008070 [Aeromonas hydrophila]|uniref:VCBS domain-containing protein n=1 Tax=Aeromonas hydrophila TaxID=644 RepID=UPI00101B0731|nr:Ig-like domain-containing protein [Aeromonas hydrophila]BBG83662.1 hypothetical protein AHGSH82_008070 [Aeromonas hydrophila]BBT61003.1 hypothetical protein WP8S18E02_08000 [Aeromonas hydrophila]
MARPPKVTITITGTDDAPVISADTGAVTEGDQTPVTGTLTASDADNPTLTFVAGSEERAFTGTDDAPVISADTGAVTEGDQTPTGTLTASDADNPTLTFVAGSEERAFGRFEVGTDGKFRAGE